jgi:hypothetical protein
MAVRDDFAPGEVLAAADLNDTFASKLPYSYGTATPSTTTTGFLWYDSNSTPPTTKYWNGSSFANLVATPGLTLVASESFSAVSNVSVNGCFTSAYTHYRILGVMTTASGGADLQFRLRASSTDNTSGYTRQRLQGGSTTVEATSDATTLWVISLINASRSSFSMDIFGPQSAATTGFTAHGGRTDGVVVTAGAHSASTSYDGFTLLTSASTITGNLRVYGYKD